MRIDPNNLELPTEKQIKFAERIAIILNLELPDIYSKNTYSAFISEHIKELPRRHYTRVYSRPSWYYDDDCGDGWSPTAVYDASWFT